MAIGIESSCLFGPRSGIGYYTKHLVEGIARLQQNSKAAPQANLLLLSHRSLNGDSKLSGANQWRFPIKPFWFHVLLPQIARKLQLDLVHFPNYIVPLRWNRPYVLTVHDLSVLRNPGWHPRSRRLVWASLLERSLRGAELIMCVSSSAKRDLVKQLKVDSTKIRVTPLAPAAHFRPASREQIAKVLEKYDLPSNYVLYVGNIEPRKNLPRLIEAWHLAGAQSDCRLPLVLAGRPAWLYQETLQAVRKSPWSSRIYLTGYVAEWDLPALYSGAQFFVYPSLFEGFGLPVLEAMACGVPVVASHLDPLKEVCGEAALFVNPNDARSMADGIKQLMKDSEFREYFRERGLEVASRYSWEKTAHETLAVYNEALGKNWGQTPISRFSGKLVSVPNFSPEECGILRTVLYSSLFDYPLKPPELHAALIECRLTESEIVECYHRSIPLRKLVDFQEDHFFPRGRTDLVVERKRREARSQDLLQANRFILKLICAIPFTRLVALSGSAAHLNMNLDEDIDLFIVTRGKRVWSAAVAILLITKLLRRRKIVCFNFIVSDRRLRIPQADLFTANQIIHLRPLFGNKLHHQLLKENRFVFECYPNFVVPDETIGAFEPGRVLTILKRALELLLCPGPSQLQEYLCRTLYRRYLKSKASLWSSPQEVFLDDEYLKLHTQSHRQKVMGRFNELVAKAVESLA